MALTPKEFAQQAAGFLPDAIYSIILYGSSPAGDFEQEVSDHNILVIARRLNLTDLKALASLAQQWTKQGNRPPLLFTLDEARHMADTFPLEVLDIRDAHEILAGQPLLAEWQVSLDNLRLQLEREFKEKLLRLREQYLLATGNATRVIALMVDSLSNFLVLARGTLRLFEQKLQPDVPRSKLDAVNTLVTRVPFNPAVFHLISEIRRGHKLPRDVPADDTFAEYLRAIETIEKAVNDFRHTNN